MIDQKLRNSNLY